jgi:hypothetical protein
MISIMMIVIDGKLKKIIHDVFKRMAVHYLQVWVLIWPFLSCMDRRNACLTVY